MFTNYQLLLKDNIALHWHNTSDINDNTLKNMENSNNYNELSNTDPILSYPAPGLPRKPRNLLKSHIS